MALYNAYIDEELVSFLQNGDEKAFVEIYLRYRRPLSSFAFSFSGSREDALDIVQDVFASLWNLRGKLSIAHSLKAYLFQAVRNGCILKMDRLRRGNALLESLAVAWEKEAPPSLHLQVEAHEAKKELDAAIYRLPEKMQQVFRLSREEGLSHAEIGQRLNISPNTVKVHIQGALKAIRSQIGSISGFVIFLFSHLPK